MGMVCTTHGFTEEAECVYCEGMGRPSQWQPDTRSFDWDNADDERALNGGGPMKECEIEWNRRYFPSKPSREVVRLAWGTSPTYQTTASGVTLRAGGTLMWRVLRVLS